KAAGVGATGTGGAAGALTAAALSTTPAGALFDVGASTLPATPGAAALTGTPSATAAPMLPAAPPTT
ncbi:MAG TPA: hypothetical protein VMV93_06580, partial [Chloroflexota bacterium]|nr:hypothetical protein [Chloroflexota bacterium]